MINTNNYSIKDISKITKLSLHAIRFYDEKNLIIGVKRNSNNIRVFNDQSLESIKFITCLKASGMSISEIQEFVTMYKQGDTTIPKRLEIVSKREIILQEQLEITTQQIKNLEAKKQYYQNILNNKSSEDLK